MRVKTNVSGNRKKILNLYFSMFNGDIKPRCLNETTKLKLI